MLLGDYDHRHSTLEALMRPGDLVEYDILLAEMAAGRCGAVSPWAATGAYILMASRGVWLAAERTPGHPMLYLQHALEIQRGGKMPPLVGRASEQLASRPAGWIRGEA